MGQATGANTVIQLGEETTFGTTPGVPDGKLLGATKFGVGKKQNLIDSNVLSASRGKLQPMRGNISADGSVDVEIAAENMGILFKHLMGVDTPTGTSPYTHVYTGGALPVSLWAEVDYGAAISGSGRFMLYNGVRINSADFNFPNEGACTATFNLMGRDGTAAAATVDATPTNNGHTTFSGFDAVVLEGGLAIATVKSAKITVNNNLDNSSYVIGGAGKRSAMNEGFLEISGTLELSFADAVVMNKALAGTSSTLKITLSRGTGLGTAGNESIEFLVQQLIYEPTTPSVDGPGGISITLPFKAYKSGANLGLQITVKNNVATI